MRICEFFFFVCVVIEGRYGLIWMLFYDFWVNIIIFIEFFRFIDIGV